MPRISAEKLGVVSLWGHNVGSNICSWILRVLRAKISHAPAPNSISFSSNHLLDSVRQWLITFFLHSCIQQSYLIWSPRASIQNSRSPAHVPIHQQCRSPGPKCWWVLMIVVPFHPIDHMEVSEKMGVGPQARWMVYHGTSIYKWMMTGGTPSSLDGLSWNIYKWMMTGG